MELITHDAVTTANILKAANSAYYGRSKPFESIHQATVFLGMDEVVDLTLISSSADKPNRPQAGYGLKSGELWRYAVASALLARRPAAYIGSYNLHLVFTAALLKDIGKVVLSHYN